MVMDGDGVFCLKKFDSNASINIQGDPWCLLWIDQRVTSEIAWNSHTLAFKDHTNIHKQLHSKEYVHIVITCFVFMYIYIFVCIKWIATVTHVPCQIYTKPVEDRGTWSAQNQHPWSIRWSLQDMVLQWNLPECHGVDVASWGLRMFDDNHYMTNYYRIKLWMCGIHVR